MRSSVKNFAEAMEIKLQQYDHERGTAGWLKSPNDISFLLDQLSQKEDKLIKAYAHSDPIAMQSKCVNIANYAMMIFDRISKFSL